MSCSWQTSSHCKLTRRSLQIQMVSYLFGNYCSGSDGFSRIVDVIKHSNRKTQKAIGHALTVAISSSKASDELKGEIFMFMLEYLQNSNSGLFSQNSLALAVRVVFEQIKRNLNTPEGTAYVGLLNELIVQEGMGKNHMLLADLREYFVRLTNVDVNSSKLTLDFRDKVDDLLLNL
jgi:hypothetical protein